MVSKAMELAVTNPLTCFTSSKPLSDPSSILRAFTVRCSVSLSSDRASTGVAERPWKTSDARLVLEDGSIWRAKSFGASGTQVGEVVFNTSLTG
nr:carbamoyl-phosphate synthase small chain, chloroplastic-like [Quercus suber]